VAAVGRPRLLVLRALGIGDLLTAVPALRALADAFPDHRRTLACPRALKPLVELTRAVDEVVDTAPLASLDASLHGVEVAVDLHGRGPQSHRLLAELAPGALIAFANEEAGILAGPRWRPGEHEVTRWCRLLEESGMPADPARLHVAPPAADAPDGVHGATLIHPGAASGSRQWPADRFAAVASAEIERGRTVVITGGPSERPLAQRVAGLAGVPPTCVLAGATDLTALAAAVAAAGRVVCGDTGVAHLATALGTPSVLLFGPVSPAEWGPPPDRRQHRAIWKRRPGDPHGRETDRGLLEIGVDDVLAELDDLPERLTATA
jgi:ADP-heptose:LPS heptosyltransferase